MAVAERSPVGAGPRGGRRIRLALALLVLATLLRGVAWAAALPPWQGPDEPAHYEYVERLANGDYPPRDGAQVPSAALLASLNATGYDRFLVRTPDRPLDAPLHTLPRERPDLSEAGRGALSATAYPPLYYAALVPLYRLPGLTTATDRLYAVRFGSALMGAALVWTAFLLFRRVARDGLAVLGAALLSLAPLVSQASAICNPDIGLALLSTALALCCVRLRLDGVTPLRALGTLALAVAVSATKPVGPVAAGVIVAALLGVPWLLSRRRGALVTSVAVPLAGLAVYAGALWHDGFSPLANARYAVSYVWQFYLPPLPFMEHIFSPGIITDPVPAWAIWMRTGVGYFGWISAAMPRAVYQLAALTIALGALGALVVLVRERRLQPAGRGALLVAAALAVLLFVVALHTAELAYLLQTRGTDRLLQGRYLLPVIPLALLPVVAALDRLPPRGARAAALALASTWVLIAVAGLDTVLRFYAS